MHSDGDVECLFPAATGNSSPGPSRVFTFAATEVARHLPPAPLPGPTAPDEPGTAALEAALEAASAAAATPEAALPPPAPAPLVAAPALAAAATPPPATEARPAAAVAHPKRCAAPATL